MIIVEVIKCGWLSEYITLYLLLPIGAIEGLLVGWGEAQPLDMRYQAEPRREGKSRVCLRVRARSSLWICVTRQSLVTRDVLFRLSQDRNNAVKIKILILLYKLRMNPQKFAASVLHPHQATKTRIFCF